MIPPGKMIEKVVALLNANKQAIGIKAAIEISEEPSKNLTPPYCGVFADTENETDQAATNNMLLAVPIEVKVWCFSSEKQTGAQSFAQAWEIARNAASKIVGPYTFTPEEMEIESEVSKTVPLKLRKRPRDVQAKKAKQSVVVLNLYYEDPWF